jgi:hypothetical protein
MGLETVVKLVEQHSGAISPSPTKAEKVRAENEIVRSMFTALMIGMAIIGIGVLLLVVNKTLNIAPTVNILASFLLLGGTGYSAYAVLNGVRKGTSLAIGRSQQQQLPHATDKSLPTNPFAAELPSVSEGTTQLISSRSTEQEQEFK